MALVPKTLDPVQSLINYTLEVKPYHTKIMEVLVEYIHTDYIKATIDDNISFCFNFGYPDLNTLFEYTITNISTSGIVTVAGNATDLIHIGQRFQIVFGLENDGYYYVNDISFDDFTQETTITIRGGFANEVVIGKVVNSVIDHCGFGGGMLSTNVHPLKGVECLGGYGAFYDSFVELVISVDLIGSQLFVVGDHTIKFKGTNTVSLIDNNLNQLLLIDTVLDVNTITVLGDITSDVVAGQVITLLSDHFIPFYSTDRQSYQVGTSTFNGTETIITLTQPLPDTNIVGYIEFSEVVGLLQIETEQVTDIFGDTILQNKVYFDGANTVIPILNDIGSFPDFNPSSTYHILIQYIGYDDPFYCSTGETSGETLYVNMREELDFEFTLDFKDNLHTYNWENTARNGYDTVDFGTIDSFTEPPLPEQPVAPVAPALFDLWYDTANSRMFQWRNYGWVGITSMYWYQEDPADNQIVTYYKRVKNNLVDTGWLEFDPTMSDVVSSPYDEGGYSDLPYNVYHDDDNLDINLVRNSIAMFGGDYRAQLVNNETITGYNSISIAQSGIKHDSYSLVGIDSSNRLKVLGDHTVFFVVGVTFGVTSPQLKHTDYNVISSTFDGTYTLITVAESLVDIDNNVLTDVDYVDGYIPAIFYAQPNTFEYDTVVTIFSAIAPLTSDILLVDYYWNGPYQFNITTSNAESITVSYTDTMSQQEGIIPPTDTSQTTFGEDLVFEWGDITEWFQYMILNVPTLDTLIVRGNAVADLQTNIQINILGFVDNAGIYTVLSSFFDGINTVVTLTADLPTDTAGGFVESAIILPITISLKDEINLAVTEDTYASLVEAGSLVDSLDYKYFDMGGFDETVETLHLNR